MSSIGRGALGTSPRQPPPPKQIRFVNNEGQPPPKRRRITAACRTCRKRKTRCDGKRPICSTCTENGHECLGYAKLKRDDEGNDDEHHEEKSYDPAGDKNAHLRDSDVGQPKPSRDAKAYSYFDSHSNGSKQPGAGKAEGQSRPPFVHYIDRLVFDENQTSPVEERRISFHTENHRVPYFRYFGPTAIVPGFKQMVVSVREPRRSTGERSTIVMSPGSNRSHGGSSIFGPGSSQTAQESRPTGEMPVYDQADSLPVNRLIIHLVETFFSSLGSNYPFLRQKSFIQRVEEKSVEPILVDAICGLAARFSDHPLLVPIHDAYPKSEYGHQFAQRAKAAVVDTFPCPTVAAVQACLLLAYEGFGANQDSALWMYLGCAIRMAVDLGLQKLDGVKHRGQKDPGNHRSSNDMISNTPEDITAQEKKEIEQERIDTMWAVFMLDRVISSGTGRPVTLRDEDFELSFPAVIINTEHNWPNPFPALIQIIHLYGRVSDLLNNIRDVKDVTPKKIEGLSSMEKDLTQLYQKLDQRLTFNAANFQHYVKSGEGTNFILVHFWFHTLIMLLHQPTLMHSLEGQVIQLLPNSRELSISSAKTIADILAFAELIDARSFIGNPFTSQPIYIAACAFLMESAAHTTSRPISRDGSPSKQDDESVPPKDTKARVKTNELKQKHSLLASAANQNYQRCYKALQQLETYWAGTRYILVALDQKAKGIWDPETYTEQEYESTKIKHDLVPNWRKRLPPISPSSSVLRSPRLDNLPSSPAIDPAQAIGWSLTGTTNSSSSNLTLMYQNLNGENAQPLPQSTPLPQTAGTMIYDPIRGSIPEGIASSTTASNHPRYPSYRHTSQNMPPPASKYTALPTDPASTSDAEMLLRLQNSPYVHTPGSNNSFEYSNPHGLASLFDYGQGNGVAFLGGDMMMESQEIDMSSLGGEMMPWLEYLPQDMLNFFDGNVASASGG